MNDIQLLTNAQIRELGIARGTAKVTDLRTGRTYDIFWGGSPNTHTDFSPLTPADTETMRHISNGWNWNARPVVLHIGSHNLAAAVHHFPHGSIIGGNPGLPNMSNTRPASGWSVGGHMCMYFKDSVSNSGDSQHARDMRAAAEEALRLAQSSLPAAQVNSLKPGHTPDTWAVPAWLWAMENLAMDGTRPRDNITRQEVMVLLYRLFDFLRDDRVK